MSDVRRLVSLLHPYRGRLVAAFLASGVVSLCVMAYSSLALPLFNEVLAGGEAPTGALPGARLDVLQLVRRWLPLDPASTAPWIAVPALLVVLYLVKGIAGYLAEFGFARVGLSVIRDLRAALHARLQELSLAYFASHTSSELVARVVSDVQRLQKLVGHQLPEAAGFVLILVGQIAWILYLDDRLTLLCLVVAPLVVAPLARFGRRLKRVSRRSQERMAEVTETLQESLVGARVVRAYGTEAHEHGRFRRALDRMLGEDLKAARVQALTTPVMELTGALAAGALFFYAGRRIHAGELDTGQFMGFLVGLGWIFLILKRLGKLNNDLQAALAAARRAFEVLDAPISVEERPDARPLPAVEGRVELRDVHFDYDGTPVLAGVDLEVPKGSTVALVGPSGAGKTSLVSLVPRLYDVSAGAVTVDGHDVRELRLDALRSAIGIVTQETVLFRDTVRHNIAYGRPEATDEEVRRAARMARADAFVEALPEGYDTVVGEQGSRLSAGQRQRLSIARAFLKDAPILILDEATASLDAESEALVQQALEQLLVGRTVLVIAHRLSTVRRADAIVVLDAGRVVERGRHEELLARGSTYARLHALQGRETPDDPALSA